jgi:hypothetical protein
MSIIKILPKYFVHKQNMLVYHLLYVIDNIFAVNKYTT